MTQTLAQLKSEQLISGEVPALTRPEVLVKLQNIAKFCRTLPKNVRYDVLFRDEVVKYFETGNDTIANTAHSIGIPIGALYKWKKEQGANKATPVVAPVKPTPVSKVQTQIKTTGLVSRYSDKFKADVSDEFINGNDTLKTVAARYGISSKSLAKWANFRTRQLHAATQAAQPTAVATEPQSNADDQTVAALQALISPVTTTVTTVATPATKATTTRGKGTGKARPVQEVRLAVVLRVLNGESKAVVAQQTGFSVQTITRWCNLVRNSLN